MTLAQQRSRSGHVTNGSYVEVRLGFLLGQRLASILELLPVRRVLQGFVVLRERLFGLALLHEYIGPSLQRIRPLRSPLIRSHVFGNGTGRITLQDQ